MDANLHINQKGMLQNRVEQQSEYVAKAANLQLQNKNLMDNLSQHWENLRSRLNRDFFEDLGKIFGAGYKVMETLTKAGWCAIMTKSHDIQGKIIFSSEELRSMEGMPEEIIKQNMKAGIVGAGIETDQKKINTAVDTFIEEHPELGQSVHVTGDNASVVIHMGKDASANVE